MTQVEQIAELVQLGFGLAGLLAVFFVFRSYRVETLRDRLFAVRQELFDCARSGDVEFSDPAYATLRRLINSLIRYAHQLTLFRVSVGSLWPAHDQDPGKTALAEWRQAVSQLPPETKKKLEDIHSEALLLVVRHIVTGSPIAVALGACILVWSLIHGATKSFLTLLAERMPGLDSYQSQAITADSLDRGSLHGGAAPA